jgi:excisionase family DNA binding protein
MKLDALSWGKIVQRIFKKTEVESETMDAERVRMRDLQERLSVSRATLNRWLADGMPSEKLGGVRLFDLEQVTAWIATRAKPNEPRRRPLFPRR